MKLEIPPGTKFIVAVLPRAHNNEKAVGTMLFSGVKEHGWNEDCTFSFFPDVPNWYWSELALYRLGAKRAYDDRKEARGTLWLEVPADET